MYTNRKYTSFIPYMHPLGLGPREITVKITQEEPLELWAESSCVPELI